LPLSARLNEFLKLATSTSCSDKLNLSGSGSILYLKQLDYHSSRSKSSKYRSYLYHYPLKCKSNSI
jgi:hypothetical protein